MLNRKRAAFFALLFAFTMVVSACGDSEDTTTTAAAETTIAANPAITACQVTDTGGIDDKSFNQTAWKGVTDAIEDGLATDDSDYVESQVETDYAPNVQAMLDKDCDLIVTVGYLLGDATATAATDNPDQLFEILDFAYDPAYDNVIGAVFTTNQAAFLAGYLAAGVSKTGKVATYGGMAIPGAVTDFMDGFVWGVDYYNEQKGTSVEVLGWDVASQSGSFTGDFESLDNGRAVTQSFIDEGADVILPVAGPVGEATAALAAELSDVWVVGVDADWFQTLPQYSDVILTSVLKGLDVAVYDAIEQVVNGTFQGGTMVMSLANNGVGLGAINDAVDPALAAELETIMAGVGDGSIAVGG